MIRAHDEGAPFLINGTDYPTRDGSGIRDYIHIWDLAAARLAALGRFDALPAPALAINLGTGQGTTVRELLDAFNRTVEYPVRAREAARRPGDVAGAYTRIDRAERLLGGVPQRDLHDGIRHSLQWAAIRDQILPGAVSGSAQPLRSALTQRHSAPPRGHNRARSCDLPYRAKSAPWPCMAKSRTSRRSCQ